MNDLRAVLAEHEKRVMEKIRPVSEFDLRIGDAVTLKIGGRVMLIVDFESTFDSPGVERNERGRWQPLPLVASHLVTVAWRCDRFGVREDQFYRECITPVIRND